jgi:hypothetical protein
MYDIDIVELAEYFKSHTLSQCAIKYNCSVATVRRRLKSAGVDTSIHNHSNLATSAHLDWVRSKKDTSILTRDFLYNEYVCLNKDTKTIAEENNFHFNTVRDRVRKYGFKKDAKKVSESMMVRHFKKTGFMHPGHRPDVQISIHKRKSRFKYISNSKKTYLFRSLHELCFALVLENKNVLNWDYELIRVQYVDRLTGKMRMYYVDFSYQSDEGDYWVEVKPAKIMIPTDKRLYASQAAKKAGSLFRGLTDEERNLGHKYFIDGYNKDNITFVNKKDLKLDKCYTFYFKNKLEISEIKHDHYIYIEEVGPYVKCKFVAKASNKINL